MALPICRREKLHGRCGPPQELQLKQLVQLKLPLSSCSCYPQHLQRPSSSCKRGFIVQYMPVLVMVLVVLVLTSWRSSQRCWCWRDGVSEEELVVDDGDEMLVGLRPSRR